MAVPDIALVALYTCSVVSGQVFALQLWLALFCFATYGLGRRTRGFIPSTAARVEWRGVVVFEYNSTSVINRHASTMT